MKHFIIASLLAFGLVTGPAIAGTISTENFDLRGLTETQKAALVQQIEKFKGGVAQQNLSLAQVQDFQIPLPPLPEQQRIVGILDEAFEGIARLELGSPQCVMTLLCNPRQSEGSVICPT